MERAPEEEKMREIKFRAWDTFRKMMYDCDEDTKHSLWNPNLPVNQSLAEHKRAGIMLMQFTGLKDKHGKEIYEGDIVVCCRYDDNTKYEVVIEDIRHLDRWLFGSSLNWREVIGNIYENPELLKEERK